MSLILSGTDGLSDVDGTAATPAIRGTDANTGMFFPAADTIAFSEGGVESARIDSSGNLGVGTASPSGRVHAVSAPGSVQVRWSDATNGTANLDTAAGLSRVWTNVGLAFGTGAETFTERARIDSSGNLLVGQTSTSKTNNGVQIYSASGNNGRIDLSKTASGLYSAIANYYNGTYVGGVDYSNSATSFPTSSDVRLKKDVVDAPSASEKIDQIRIVSHGWKHDEATVEFGVIAQELYAVSPQAVSKGDDGEAIEKTWGVDYSKLVPMLVKEIQSLRARVAQLEAK